MTKADDFCCDWNLLKGYICPAWVVKNTNSFNKQTVKALIRLGLYSKTCLKWPLKNRQNKGLRTGFTV